MRSLILTVLFSFVVLSAAQWETPISDMPRDEFVGIYVNLFTNLIREKSQDAFQEHNAYLDPELFFHECFTSTYVNYAMFRSWLQQFVLRHSDPRVTILGVGGDEQQAKFRIDVDVAGMFGLRMHFPMEFLAVNENHSGWTITVINRSIHC